MSVQDGFLEKARIGPNWPEGPFSVRTRVAQLDKKVRLANQLPIQSKKILAYPVNCQSNLIFRAANWPIWQIGHYCPLDIELATGKIWISCQPIANPIKLGLAANWTPIQLGHLGPDAFHKRPYWPFRQVWHGPGPFKKIPVWPFGRFWSSDASLTGRKGQ